ncbi:hypothetical protein PO878_05420 [Iamia majanohamensis]|uniref:Uncharacterized protein n=1 Tax=Iamia majanohamensis TaxID=467976 RepID=A0AAE9YBP8_9ACTN|nr:hypothetical protein [Iamia majanohamensis]WCO68163.1 hypothetical protein PO878_05420 [Iamia majanohamensis]
MQTTRKKAAAALASTLAAGGVAGALLFTPVASSAQDGTTTTTEAAAEDGGGTEREAAREEHRAEREAALAELAEVLGTTPDELRAAREDGLTLAEVAEANGVDRQTVVDHIVAAQTARLEERIAELPEAVEAVVDGEGPLGGPGGLGLDGPGGPGGHRGPPRGEDLPPAEDGSADDGSTEGGG